MLIAALLLALLGAGLFIGVHFTRKRLATLIIAKTRKAAELVETAASVGREIGAGGFKELVELVGTLECPQPLVSPLGEQRCVSYTVSIVREYEEDYEEKDQNGNVRRGTRRGSESVHSDSQRCDFSVRDTTGALAVSANDVDFDGSIQSVSRFESGGVGTGTLRIGNFSLSVPMGGGRRRTLGYRYTEHVFPVGRQITVIGEASDASGTLTVRKPDDLSFIVSTRTRKELRGSAETTAKVLGVLGTLSFIGALVTGVLGVLRH